MFSIRLELDRIQHRWREPRYEDRHQSRAGELAEPELKFLERECEDRFSPVAHYYEELPRDVRIDLAIWSAGKVTAINQDAYGALD